MTLPAFEIEGRMRGGCGQCKNPMIGKSRVVAQDDGRGIRLIVREQEALKLYRGKKMRNIIKWL